MKKRISKKMREEAAVFCAAIVTAEFDVKHAVCPCAICMRSQLWPSDAAFRLALKARDAVPLALYPNTPGTDYGLRFGEAEAMLRTGFTPDGWE